MCPEHQEKIRKEWSSMPYTIFINVGVLFTWSVRISLYGNSCKYNKKIRKTQEKNDRRDVDSFDNVDALFIWSVHISQYSN